MKITFAKLASQRFTTALLGFMFCWFAVFPYLIKINGSKKVVKLLNHSLLIDWFRHNSNSFPSLKFWFIGLGLLMTLLTINLIVCTWRRFPPKFGLGWQKSLLFLIHLFFALLLAGHAAGFVWGWRPAQITAFTGETLKLDQHYQITVNKITFKNNPVIFNKSRQEWNLRDFNYQLNRAKVSLQKNGHEIISGEISTYNPLQRGSLQITLREFIAPRPGMKTPGIRIQVSRAPFADSVIWLFHGLILLTFIYILSIVKLPAADRQD